MDLHVGRETRRCVALLLTVTCVLRAAAVLSQVLAADAGAAGRALSIYTLGAAWKLFLCIYCSMIFISTYDHFILSNFCKNM